MAAVIDFPKRPGKYRCPQCSGGRKNTKDKSLSVHLDGGKLYYRCHHCEWKGKLDSDYQPVQRVAYVKPKYHPQDAPTDKLLAWFEGRGIPADIVRRNHIETATVRFGETEEKAIAFPYYRNGEIVNVKYRTADKRFRMETGAEMTLYGIDDIRPDCVYVVEGEPDRLSVQTVGLQSVVSVPNGAGTNLDILANCEDVLDGVKKFVMAGDNDPAGLELQNKLIRRLGPERCWRVEWPEGCKDANDVLVKCGASALVERLQAAKPMPIEGSFGLEELLPDLVRLYNEGRPRGLHPGWNNLAEYYKPRLGQWTVVSGSPNSGKSAFCRALLVNLAIRYDWQFVVFPPEDCPPEEYWSLLLELYTGEPFDDGPTRRMAMETMLTASEWVDKHFVLLNPQDGQRNFDALLDKAKAYILRRGINGLVIDPWNRVEHHRPEGTTGTEYIGVCLDKLSTFSKLYQLHNFIVAHPAKPRVNRDGQYVKGTLYDISDSAHFHNMSDFGLILWRDKENADAPVEINIQKVRSRWCGKLGTAQLFYDLVTGRYSESRTEIGRLPYPEDEDEVIN